MIGNYENHNKQQKSNLKYDCDHFTLMKIKSLGHAKEKRINK